MHLTEGVAEFVAGFHQHELGDATRIAVARCVFDLATAVAAGFGDPGARAVRRLAEVRYGDGQSPIWFGQRSASVEGAIWANCAAAAALDLDDGNRLARGHPGAAIIPPVLAYAAEAGASDEEVVRAIMLGYEVGISVGAARGFYGNTGTWSGYGVVAAISYLRSLPAETIAHALSIAGITSPQMLAQSGGPVYPMPVGNHVKEGIPWASVSAFQAVILAENGMKGPIDILDHAPHYRTKGLLEGLGHKLYIEQTYFKLYTCCRHLHAPIDALLQVMQANRIAPGEIEHIKVHTYSGGLRLSNRADPANLVDMQYSIPYGLGIAATMGAKALLPVTDGVLGRADAKRIAERVTLELDPDIEGRFPRETPTRLCIKARGEMFDSGIVTPRGEAGDPLSWADLEGKFRTATRLALDEVSQDAVIAAVRELKSGQLAAFDKVLRTVTACPGG